MTRVTVALAALVALGPSLAAAQSLADVARAEEARRKVVTKPAKVYTNDTLTADFTSSATPLPPPAAAPTGETPAAAPAAPAGGQAAAAPAAPTRDQAYWSARINAARAQLQRSRTFVEALQSRINALTTDFVNRDDPAQRAVIEQDRIKALAELDRLRKEMDEQAKAIAGIEDEARRAGVPAGWLR